MGHALYELDVRLRGITPPIWRTIELAGSSTLEDLHFAIQVAMGWESSHLHQFTIGKKSYGMTDVDEGMDLEDERAVRLQDLAAEGDAFTYEYDFGDDWEHAITIKRVTNVAKAPRPRCTAGQRACPPEDCGGAFGYERLLQVLADPKHPEHAELREWSDDFEPEHFELPKAGRDLRREMDQLKALAQAGGDDGTEDDEADDADLAALGLPRPLVEAVLDLEPMQRASLAALLTGSLADEVMEMRRMTAQLVDGLRQRAKPTRGARKRTRS